MRSGKTSAIIRLALSIFFFPAVFGTMIWLWMTGQHWVWGVLVIAAVLIFDPIYRIIGGSILSWRPHPRDK
ncbi:hypothetical protein [Litorimonas sp. WD9-15]|uniref:hypothetical protein n=1 Tax=Litorimonas sp. WD9-15 TaxID=3418716 RepID=UPI003D06400F